MWRSTSGVHPTVNVVLDFTCGIWVSAGGLMESTEVYSRLNDLFRNVFDNDEMVITPELTASEVDGWDSLRHVRLMLTIERAFGIKFSAYEVNKLRNVGQLAKLIQDKVGVQA